MSASKVSEVVDALVKAMIDNGRLIEAGWLSMRAMSIPFDAPEVQLVEMRNAFFAGAQHLWASIMGVLDHGSEPTEDDLRRFSNIDEELKGFLHELRRMT